VTVPKKGGEDSGLETVKVLSSRKRGEKEDSIGIGQSHSFREETLSV
jgi:hypothetical protein